jgi:hypothetical protein
LQDLIKINNNSGVDYTEWPGGSEFLRGGGGGEGGSFTDWVTDFLSTNHGLSPAAVDEIMEWLDTLD